MEAPNSLPIASMTLLGAATAVRCCLFGQRWRQRQQDGVQWWHLAEPGDDLQRHRGLSSMHARRSGGARLHAGARASFNQHMHPGARWMATLARGGCCRAPGNAFCADWRALCAELEQLDAADSIARHTGADQPGAELAARHRRGQPERRPAGSWLSAPWWTSCRLCPEALGQARAISAAACARPVHSIRGRAGAAGPSWPAASSIPERRLSSGAGRQPAQPPARHAMVWRALTPACSAPCNAWNSVDWLRFNGAGLFM